MNAKSQYIVPVYLLVLGLFNDAINWWDWKGHGRRRLYSNWRHHPGI